MEESKFSCFTLHTSYFTLHTLASEQRCEVEIDCFAKRGIFRE
jgi:hypothetical protein